MKTVLIADDEKSVRDMLKAYFERNGWKTLIACDGKEALELMHDKVDKAILDVRMPFNHGGTSVLLEIKRLYPKTKTVILSGSVEIVTNPDAFDADFVFQKPADLKALCEC